MALYDCLQSTQIGKAYYRKGSWYEFSSDPGARFALIPEEEANARKDRNLPLPCWRDIEEDYHVDVPLELEQSVSLNGPVLFTETAEPETPPTGQAHLYLDENNQHLKQKDYNGIVLDLASQLPYVVGANQEFATIQAAIDAVEASGEGGVVLVLVGVYTEDLVISKPGVSIVSSTSWCECTNIIGSVTIDVDATSESTIEGLHVHGALEVTGSEQTLLWVDDCEWSSTGEDTIILSNTNSNSTFIPHQLRATVTDNSGVAILANGVMRFDGNMVRVRRLGTEGAFGPAIEHSGSGDFLMTNFASNSPIKKTGSGTMDLQEGRVISSKTAPCFNFTGNTGFITTSYVFLSNPFGNVVTPLSNANWFHSYITPNIFTVFKTQWGNSLEEDVLHRKYLLDSTGTLPDYAAGQLAYDPDSFTVVADTGIEDVRVQLGQELHYIAINNTADDIPNGSVVYASGVCPTTNRIEISLALADIAPTSVKTIGLVTAPIKGTTSEPSDPTARIGMVTHFGEVRDVPTGGFTPGGALWLSTTVPGDYTQTKPGVGNQLILLGTTLIADASTGRVWVEINRTTNEVPSYKSYSTTSAGILSGSYYMGGFYQAPGADTTLTQASLTQSYGSANGSYAAHPFVVAGGAGTVDTGQVGLRCNLTSITDNGVRTVLDTETLTEDITTLVLDQYVEVKKKALGTYELELFTVSGAPTTYSLDLNYGLAKYEDFGNRDFVVTDFEVTGFGNANDTAFDVELLRHGTTGWTYSAASFVPGNGMIVQLSVDHGVDDSVFNDQYFAFKHANLTEVIEGSSSDGIVIRFTQTANGTIQSMNAHVGVTF